MWKSLFSIRNLKIHINSVHNGQKDHKCDSCGKVFSKSAILKQHTNAVHNGQKDHKCDLCGKAFSQAGYLKIHIKTIHNSKEITNVTHVEKPFLMQEI